MALDLALLLGVGVYFVSSLGGVAIVKFLNYHYCFSSWWIFALLSRSTWVLSLLLHLILQRRENVWLAFSKRQLGLYLLVAVGLSVVELLNSFSMSMLPGSLYMLLKGSDVGWSMSLSYGMLHKRYNFCQIVAAGLIMLGIALVFIMDIYSRPDATDTDKLPTTPGSFPITTAALLCLLGAFLNALCSVATEAMLKKTLQYEQERLLHEHEQSTPPSKLLLSNAYSMWTSFFSFSLLVIPVFVKERAQSDNHDFDQISIPLSNSSSSICLTVEPNYQNAKNSSSITGSDMHSSSMATALSVGIFLSLAFLGASRFLERLGKHFICVHDSAVTFSIVQAARRWIGIYIVGILFHEGFAKGMILGSLMSGIGFVLHSQSSKSSSTKATSSESRTRVHAYEKVTSSDIIDKDDDAAGSLEMSETPARNGAAIEAIS